MSGIGKTFEHYGIDPVSRAAGIEPKSAGKKVGKTLDVTHVDLSVPVTPPPPTREDPSIAEARKKQRLAELQRRGRQAMILAGKGAGDELGNVVRPEAKAVKLFGE